MNRHRSILRSCCWLTVILLVPQAILAQELPDLSPEKVSAVSGDPAPDTAPTEPAENQGADKVPANADDLVHDARGKVEEIARKIDTSATARDVAAGILQPIYQLAESLAFPSFHWLAFALMSAGVVSFSFQLVLGKLVVLMKGSINLREIFSDSVGLVISAVGLVLTTQASAENSTFTQSAAAVLSAAAAGAVLGLCLYRWGQAQEISAARGQRSAKPKHRS